MESQAVEQIKRAPANIDASKLFVSLGSYSTPFTLFGDINFKTCPDGTVVGVLKDLNKAFPQFANEWNANVGLVLEGLKGITAKFGIDIGKRADQVYKDLDRISADLSTDYRANYVEFAARPCDPESIEILRRANEQVRNATIILRMMQLELERPVPDISRLEEDSQQLMKLVLAQ